MNLPYDFISGAVVKEDLVVGAGAPAGAGDAMSSRAG